MRDTTRKESASRVAAWTRSGGGVRAVRLPSGAGLLAAAPGAPPSVGAHGFCPHGPAADAAGYFHIFDRDSRRIRRADSNKLITSISGTGEHRLGVGCGPSHAARNGSDQ